MLELGVSGGSVASEKVEGGGTIESILAASVRSALETA